MRGYRWDPHPLSGSHRDATWSMLPSGAVGVNAGDQYRLHRRRGLKSQFLVGRGLRQRFQAFAFMLIHSATERKEKH